MKTGADISHWQSSFDATRYKGAGEDFIFLKATEGRSFVDSTFVRRWKAARAAGLPRGAYHYGYPGSSLVDQVEHFVRVAMTAGWEKGDVFILDMEAHDNQSPAAITTWSNQWITRVRDALGGRGLFYTFPYFWRDQMGDPNHIPGGALGWWARYYSHPYRNLFKPAAWPDPPAVWQCSNGQSGCAKSVASIGPCDYNQMTDAAFAVLFQGQEEDVPLTDAEIANIANAVNDRVTNTLRVGFAGSKDRPVREWAIQLEQVRAAVLDDESKVLEALGAITSKVGHSEQAILGALAVLELNLTDEQITAIASAVNVDEAKLAEAVRFRLHEALST